MRKFPTEIESLEIQKRELQVAKITARYVKDIALNSALTHAKICHLLDMVEALTERIEKNKKSEPEESNLPEPESVEKKETKKKK